MKSVVAAVCLALSLYRLGYLAYGAKGPALWEATVYRTDLGWKVLDLSVGTDKIFEKIADGYR